MDSFKVLVGIILLVYVMGLLILGFFLRKRAAGLEGFLVAKRKLPVLFTTLSLTASIIGASMTFAAVSKFYTMGMSAIWFSLGPAFFLMIMGIFLAKRIRATRALTLPHLVEKIFDRKARVITAVLVILAEILWIAVLATATRDVLVSFLGMEPYTALFLSLGAFSLYTILAGKVADAYTDVIQAFMMGFLVFVLLIAALMKGGADLSSVPNSSWSFFEGHTPMSLIALFLLLGLSYLVGPDVYASILSAKSQRVAQFSAILGAGLIFLWGIIMAMLGLLARSILAGYDSPSVMNDLIIETVGFAPLRALLVAGLIAVLMSSVDTTLLTGSSVVANDIAGPILELTKLDEEKRKKYLLYIAKGAIIPLGLFAALVGVWLVDMKEILYLAYLLFISGVVLPVTAGLLKKYTYVTNIGAVAGLLAGGIAALNWYICYREGIFDLSKTGWLYEQGIVNSTQLVGLLSCLLAMVIATIIHRYYLSKRTA